MAAGRDGSSADPKRSLRRVLIIYRCELAVGAIEGELKAAMDAYVKQSAI